jgi:putative nucleotidyltransferase with HDIG domain
MDTYQMLENIKAHSLMVARVAHLIARGLRDARYDISVELTTAAALLHDIGKTASLDSGGDHAELGREICRRNRLPKIGDIVSEHVRLKDYTVNGNCSEKEVVFYADKRVNHDTVVSLEERLEYLIGRYAQGHEMRIAAIRMNFEICKQVENKLFSKLDFLPKMVPQLVRKERIGPVI